MSGQQLMQAYGSDEISLLDLIKKLWSQKWIILAIMLVCISISTAYLCLVHPVYEAKAYVIAPTLSDINALNEGRVRSRDNSTPLPLNTKEVYDSFIDILTTSETLKRYFFKHVYLPSLTDKQKNNIDQDLLFNSSLRVIKITGEPGTQFTKYTITAHADTPIKARNWLEKYISIAKDRSTAELVESINEQNRGFAQNIKQKIGGILEVTKERRLDRIARLEEALSIAKAAGIETSANKTATLGNKSTIFFRGRKLLELEIKSLNQRKSDAPFVDGKFRQLQSDYNFYSKLKIPMEQVKIFRFDGPIRHSNTPISPKVGLILMFGLIFGLLLGSMIALREVLLKKI